jgi:hemolysin activation/secretion protein
MVAAQPIHAADINTQELLRQQERQNILRQQQEIKPDVRDEMDALKQVTPKASIVIPESETPCFSIHSIALAGANAAKFQFALDEVLAQNTPSTDSSEARSILGRCLGVQGIHAIMNRVQNAIIAKGYVTTRVLAVPQDLKAGLLQLTIIPGHVNAIRFTPDSSKRISIWNAAPINAGDILNLRDIEQTLENLKRVPTSDAEIQIEPSTENKPGQSDVVVRYQQKFPFRLSVGVDDSGLNSTGKYIGGTTLSGDNLLSLSDMFYVNYNHDLGGGATGKRGTKGYTAHYSIPWDYWLLSATTSSNEYHQEIAGASQNYIYSGISQNAEIKLNRLIYRNSINKNQSVSAQLSAQIKKLYRRHGN